MKEDILFQLWFNTELFDLEEKIFWGDLKAFSNA